MAHVLLTLAHVLGWILLALLLLALALLVLAHLLLVPRTGVHIWAGSGSGVTVKVFYAMKHVLLFPRPKKPGKKKPAPKAPEPEPEADKPARRLNWRALDLGDTICYGLDLLLQLKNTLRLDVVRVDATLATGDAAKTGTTLGYLSAGVSMLYAFLMEHFDLKTCHIAVDGDFEGRETVYDAEVSLSMRPIALEWVMLRNARRLYRIYKTLMKTEAEST